MKFIQVTVSILIAQSAGIIGSIFTAGSVVSWYETLVKPAWNPPSWVFGPVWITLYALMGVASYLVWQRRDTPGAKLALAMYIGHLALNALWSMLFFGLKNPGLAFAEILVLLLSVFVTAFLFGRINAWAGVLFLPYIIWVSFAAILNYTIWQLN